VLIEVKTEYSYFPEVTKAFNYANILKEHRIMKTNIVIETYLQDIDDFTLD